MPWQNLLAVTLLGNLHPRASACDRPRITAHSLTSACLRAAVTTAGFASACFLVTDVLDGYPHTPWLQFLPLYCLVGPTTAPWVNVHDVHAARQISVNEITLGLDLGA